MLCLEYYTFHPAHVQVNYISREAETEDRILLVPLLSFRMSAAVKKRTSPQDWIHDYYGPVLTVLASEDAEVAFTIFLK